MATTAGRPDDFLFPTGPGTQRTKAESAEMFRMVLDAAGFQTRFVDEHGRSRLIFGGHTARVAGATFLAAKLLGRWASTAVERYVQQAPLAVAAGIPAQRQEGRTWGSRRSTSRHQNPMLSSFHRSTAGACACRQGC